MYIQATAFLPLILAGNGKGSRFYIDETYSVLADMKDHRGGVYYITMRIRAVYASSIKRKINTVS